MNQINDCLWYFYDLIMIDEYNQRKMSRRNMNRTVQNHYIEFLKMHLHLQLHYFHLRNNNWIYLHWFLKNIVKIIKTRNHEIQEFIFFRHVSSFLIYNGNVEYPAIMVHRCNIIYASIRRQALESFFAITIKGLPRWV